MKIWWLKSSVLGQEPRIISLAEAAHEFISEKLPTPWWQQDKAHILVFIGLGRLGY